MGYSIGDIFFALRGDGSQLHKDMAREGDAAASTIGERFKKNLPTMVRAGATLAGATIGSFVATGTQDFARFEKGMNEVFTLMPDLTEEAMGQMEDDVKAFANETGKLPDDIIPALYDSISAGVPRENVFQFLEDANKLAVAGATDVGVAVDGLSSVMGAYGHDVLSAADAGDILFKGVQQGKTTVDELAGAISTVAPLAAGLGIGFEDVTAAMAAMTFAGEPTAGAATKLRGLMAELAQPTSKIGVLFQELAGKSFPEFVAGGGTIQEALSMIGRHATDTGQTASILANSVDAGMALMMLTSTSGAAKFNENMDGMAERTGGVDKAFQRMDSGIQATTDKIVAKIKTMALDVGEFFAPLGPLFVAFGPQMGRAIGAGLGALAGLAASFLGLSGATTANTAATTANTAAQNANSTSLLARARALGGLTPLLAGAGVAAGVFAGGALIADEASKGMAASADDAREKIAAGTVTTREQAEALLEAARRMEESIHSTKFLGIVDTELTRSQLALAQQARDTANAFLEQAGALPTVAEEYGHLLRNIEDVGHEVPRTIARAIGDGSQFVDHNVQVLLDQAAQAAGLRAFRQLGANIPGEVGRGAMEESRQVLTFASALRDILENGLTPRQQGLEAIGRDYIKLIRQGMDSQIPGAKQTAQEVAIQAIRTIQDAGLTGRKGQIGLKRIGQYFDELLASGMTGQGALAALNEAGVDVSGEALSGIRSKYPQFFTAGVTGADKTIAGLNTPDFFGAGSGNAGSFIGGLTHALRNGKGKVIGSLAPIMKLFKGHSPPVEGPLKDFDKDGENAGQTFIGGLAKGISGDLSGTLRGLGSVVDSLLQEIGGPQLGMAAVAGNLTFGAPASASSGPPPAELRAAALSRSLQLEDVDGRGGGNTFNIPVHVEGLLKARTPDDVAKPLRRLAALGELDDIDKLPRKKR